MTSPLRRGKILDIAITALFLLIFGLVPVVRLLTQDSRGFQNGKIQTAYTSLIILSWPFFCLGMVVLFYFWRKDRSIDKSYITTITSFELSVMAFAVSSTAIGCVLLFAAILLDTINRFQQDGTKLVIAIEIISAILLAWIAYLIVSVLSEVRRLKQALKEFAQNQPFPESPRDQTIRAHEPSHEARHASAEPTEPTFV